MKKNRKREVVVSTILLFASLAAGILLFMSGRTANLENFGTQFSHNIILSAGWVGMGVLFTWSLNALMTPEDKKLTKEELEKAIEPLKRKRKNKPLAYETGPGLAAWRNKEARKESVRANFM